MENGAKNHEIDYDENMAAPEIVNTILHEVLHAIVHVWGIKFKDSDQEEEVVNALGGALSTLFKDNLELLDWIKDTFHKDE